MKNYHVIVGKEGVTGGYDVEAENEDKAIHKAFNRFWLDVNSPFSVRSIHICEIDKDGKPLG